MLFKQATSWALLFFESIIMHPFSIKTNFACVMLPAIKCEGIKCVAAIKGGECEPASQKSLIPITVSYLRNFWLTAVLHCKSERSVLALKIGPFR